MSSMLSVTIEADGLEDAVDFWKLVLGGHRDPAVLTWSAEARSAFFELDDGVRLIVSAPRQQPKKEWLGIELLVGNPDAERLRLQSEGVQVSDVYETDGASRAFVVTSPEGQKLRIGTRWPLPSGDRDLSGAPGPRERDLS